MTWEDKLFEILGINKTDFDTDSDLGGILIRKKSLQTQAQSIERYIKSGDYESISEKIPQFEESYKKMKLLIAHLDRNPKCVLEEMSRNNFTWIDGKFSLGYDYAPKGIIGIKSKMLYFSRLIRDAEKRALKHPRHR